MRSITLIVLLILGFISKVGATIQATDLLQDPGTQEWRALEQSGGTLTRSKFGERLKDLFDPTGSLNPFLKITDQEVTVFDSTNQCTPVATIAFATNATPPALPVPKLETLISSQQNLSSRSGPASEGDSWISWVFSSFFPPTNASPGLEQTPVAGHPLVGLRVVIDPADIGGAWGPMEDRSTLYPGFGRIQEGDLNLLVSKILSEKLTSLGAQVFVTRNTAEPVCSLSVEEVQQVVPQVLAHRSYILSKTFRSRTQNVRQSSPIYQKIVAEILLTKNLESRARAEKTRNAIHPDITIILQFDATAARHRDSLPKINRNILFVSGAYTAKEITSDPRQRLRLLTKLLQNVTPMETRVAISISNHLVEATGFPPVLYGNSRTTRSITGNPYIVARNLLLSREHDGPVVVTEPYFMNQPETLQRLLAGDYEGTRLIAGKERMSIYREYADAVANGLVEAYDEHGDTRDQ